MPSMLRVTSSTCAAAGTAQAIPVTTRKIILRNDWRIFPSRLVACYSVANIWRRSRWYCSKVRFTETMVSASAKMRGTSMPRMAT